MASATPKDIVSGRTRAPAAAANPPSSAAASPQTPLNRPASSAFNSPSGAGYRVDEENFLVVELGARALRAGFAGESAPRCALRHGPDQARRVGDYRQHARGYDPRARRRPARPGGGGGEDDDWAAAHELWQADVCGLGVDASLLADRLERLLRDVEAAHLLLDARARKVALVVPSALPLPLLELAVAALFRVLQATAVSVLPSNVMSVVAAGLRSGLVVDVGWAETTVSAVFEFREVMQRRTVRASKSLVREYATTLKLQDTLTVEEIEDILIRLGWCRERDSQDPTETPTPISLPGVALKVPRSSLADPPDSVLFAKGTPIQDLDDHELPLHLLAYVVLLQLPSDVRKACMSRIIITGGASNIPGLKRRLLQELEHLVEQRGWDMVSNYGSAGKKRPADILAERSINIPPSTERNHIQDEPARPQTHLTPQEPDLILAKIQQQQRSRNETAVPSAVGESAFRAVHSLGPWAGASLMSGLRVRGVVEVERERFLASGLVGGAQRREVSVAQQRQSVGAAAGLRQVSGQSERGGAHWTLGVWA
jgi:hypothetical protein